MESKDIVKPDVDEHAQVVDQDPGGTDPTDHTEPIDPGEDAR